MGFGSWFAGAEAYLGKRVTLGADADYFVPTFDGDSIWNWFTHGPITTLTGRVAVRASKRFSITASGGARVWWAQGDASPAAGGLSGWGLRECQAASSAPTTANPPQPSLNLTCKLGQVTLDPGSHNPTTGNALAFSFDPANRATSYTVDAVGNLNGRYRFTSGDIAFKGMVEAGARGQREGGDLEGEKRWDGGRYTTGARASVYGWSDPTRPDRDAVSFGYVLAGRLPASPGGQHVASSGSIDHPNRLVPANATASWPSSTWRVLK